METLDVVVDAIAPYVIENDGHGRFVGRTWPRGPSVQKGLIPIHVNGDRYVDFIQGYHWGPPVTSVRLIVSRANATYVDESVQRFPGPLPLGRPLIAADFTGDGREDFLHLARSGRIHLYVMQPSGTFREAAANLPPALPVGRWGLYARVCDYDADGDLDVHLPSTSVDVLLQNDGSGSFTMLNFGAYNERTLRSHFADFDRDGDQDLFVVVEGSRALHRLYINLGNGRLVPHNWSLRAQEFSNYSAVGDLTGDGYPEIVFRPFGQTNGNAFRILSIGPGYSYRNVTNQLVPHYAPASPAEVRIGDFDNDGDLDLFTWAVKNQTTLFSSTRTQTYTPMATRIGTTLNIDTYGPPLTSAAVAVAAGSVRTPLGPIGELRLDPASLLVPFAGAIDATRRLRIPVAVPQNPWLRGRTLWFQGVHFDGQGQPRLTNSTWTRFQ